MRTAFKNSKVVYLLILLIGIFLGWVLFHTPHGKETANQKNPSIQKEPTVWTCSMHPQIRMEKPGKCPICAMDLIPLKISGEDIDPDAVKLSDQAIQLANVETSVITRQEPLKELRLYGKVQSDERSVQNQVAFTSGRIEKLWVNFTGEPVRKGQKLAVIYSPALLTAQQELIEASRTKQSQPTIYEAAREKLLNWKLSENQIAAIESSGKAEPNIEVESTVSGIVTSRKLNTGDYVNAGTVLFEVTDLSRVWVLFDAYESDLSFIKTGDPIDFSVQALPGETFSGRVKFIDPVIDPITRIAKVRIEMSNPEGKLKPEMFTSGILKSNLREYTGKLIIPKSAILWTGKRSVVYCKLPGSATPTFKMREVVLGPQLSDSYIILDGLSEGEEVVTRGTFSIDAAAQLEGKPSMMNQPVDIKSPGDVKNREDSYSAKTNTPSPVLINQHLKVSGLCDMCKDRIEKAALSVPGVSKADWSNKLQSVNLTFDSSKASIDLIARAIAQAGHDNEKFTAPDNSYKSLPECCLYRK